MALSEHFKVVKLHSLEQIKEHERNEKGLSSFSAKFMWYLHIKYILSGQRLYSVIKAVASNKSGPQFKFSHRRILLILGCIEKIKEAFKLARFQTSFFLSWWWLQNCCSYQVKGSMLLYNNNLVDSLPIFVYWLVNVCLMVYGLQRVFRWNVSIEIYIFLQKLPLIYSAWLRTIKISEYI